MLVTTVTLTFPADDAIFRDLVEATLPEAVDPAQLEAMLRRAFPRAVVRPRDSLATFGTLGPETWYCYRDGRLTSIDRDDRWWESETVAHVVIDQTDRYVEADPAACSLLGVEAGGLQGRRWSEFAEPGAVVEAEWLRQSLQRHGNGFSTFRLRREDGSALEIEYHCVVYARGETILYETKLREFTGDRPERYPPLRAPGASD